MPSPEGAAAPGEPTLRPVGVAWVLAALATVAGLVGGLLALSAGDPVPWKPLLLPALWSLPGALVAAARPRVAVGWLMLAVAMLFALSGLAEAWVVYAGPGGSTLDAPAVWYVDRFSATIVPVATLALLLLPDGRLPSPRWRVPAVVAVGAQGLVVGLWSFAEGPAAAPGSTWPADVVGLANPLGVLPQAWAEAVTGLDWLLQLPLLLCVAATVVRLRRADPGDRRPLVVLLLALVVFVAAVVAGRALWAPVADVVDVVAGLFLAGVLVAAVLRRHLDGVTVVVHHAFVATALGAVVAGAYVAVVGLLASWGPGLSRFGAGVVAATVALAVHPLRARLQRWVDRVMRGDLRDPYAALSRLAEHSHRAPSLDEVLAGVATSVAVSLRLPRVRVEAFGHRGDHPAPGSLGSGDAEPAGSGHVRTALVAGDRTVGSILVVPQPGRRLRPDEERLLAQIGRHAGLAVDSVRLAAEVAEHHRELVAAREEERRRLGRELHDDLGPTVAGLSMQLGALRPLVHADPDAVVARLARLEESAAGALADIRRVAHELRPPVLDQVGLGRAALQVAESLDLHVVDPVVEHGPLPAAVELAGYRITAEALSNVARHAGVRVVRLEIRETGGALVVVVADEGCGPVGEGSGPGLGLATMRERAEELGGTLSVRPGEHAGTVVTAVVPVSAVPVSGVPEGER